MLPDSYKAFGVRNLVAVACGLLVTLPPALAQVPQDVMGLFGGIIGAAIWEATRNEKSRERRPQKGEDQTKRPIAPQDLVWYG
jgi:hypothetical protein